MRLPAIPASQDRGQFVFDPKHYLALLEQKPGALDQAAPLQSWTLPEPLQHLRRLLEARMGNRGKREFIQVLRLMEVFPEPIVVAAATDAIRLGAISFDAVKQLVIANYVVSLVIHGSSGSAGATLPMFWNARVGRSPVMSSLKWVSKYSVARRFPENDELLAISRKPYVIRSRVALAAVVGPTPSLLARTLADIAIRPLFDPL
jgi:hypothetical protein